MHASSARSLTGIAIAGIISGAVVATAIGHEHRLSADSHGHSSQRTAKRTISPDEEAFITQSNAAMSKMMAEMAAGPSGDIDRDFVAMMIPHHQGAIDMAAAVLRFGRNEQIRRLAQEIIVTQQQEIAAMRLAIGDPPHSVGGSPAEPASP
ncbi:DUF305 domain-containing protein [Microvirga terrae]|uniref:DUF305 domain-containing protein n=1 Tax=Microvirga terrae TaxID=2740529 RepID=UPI00156ED1E5